MRYGAESGQILGWMVLSVLRIGFVRSFLVNAVSMWYCHLKKRQDSSVSIAMSHGLDSRGSIPGRDKKCCFSPQCQDGVWGPPSLLSNAYRRYSGRGLKLATHFHLSAEIKNSGAISSFLHKPSWRGTWLVKHRDNFTITAVLNIPFTQKPLCSIND
jgi:hypothetical protein